ncbi:MAG: hypothetical protein V4662_27705 [Verrucomicrobiota bacterium]
MSAINLNSFRAYVGNQDNDGRFKVDGGTVKSSQKDCIVYWSNPKSVTAFKNAFQRDYSPGVQAKFKDEFTQLKELNCTQVRSILRRADSEAEKEKIANIVQGRVDDMTRNKRPGAMVLKGFAPTGGSETELAVGRLTASVPRDPVIKTTKDGVNAFGKLDAPPSPEFLRGYKYGELPANKSASFLKAMSMTHALTPTGDSLKPDQLATKGNVTSGTKAHQIPKVDHAIWLGGPLKSDSFKANLVKTKTENPDWEVNLWTNCTREELATATDPSDMFTFKQWATDNGINLINVDEVFSGDNGMTNQDIYKAGENKRRGIGFAQSSDVLRLEVLDRFGGIYLEGDNNLVPGKTLTEVAQTAVDQEGFQAAQMDGRLNNSTFVSTKGHDKVKALNVEIQQRGWKPQYEISVLSGAPVPTKEQLDKGSHLFAMNTRVERFDVMARTGPNVVKSRVEDSAKWKIPETLLKVNSDSSWYANLKPVGLKTLEDGTTLETQTQISGRVRLATLPPQAVAPDALSGPQQQKVDRVLKDSISVLMEHMTVAPGHLDLNLVEPHIKQLPLEQQQWARETLIQALSMDALGAATSTVTGISLPKDVQMPKVALDFIFNKNGCAGPFPNLKMSTQALHEACASGQTATVDYMVKNGALLEKTDTDPAKNYLSPIGLGMDGRKSEEVGRQRTALEFAVLGGKPDVVSLITAEPSIKSQINADLIKTALGFGQIEIAADLMAKRPDITLTDKEITAALESWVKGVNIERLAAHNQVSLIKVKSGDDFPTKLKGDALKSMITRTKAYLTDPETAKPLMRD